MRLETLDASTPVSLTLESSYLLTTGAKDISGAFDVAGGIAYLGLPCELRVVDVSDPKHPAAVTSLPMADSFTPQVVEVEGETALVGLGSKLLLLDVSNPAAPVLLSSFETGGWITVIQALGDLVYVACREGGAQVIAINDPGSLYLVHRYYGFIHSIQTGAGQPVYLGMYDNGLHIYRPYPPVSKR